MARLLYPWLRAAIQRCFANYDIRIHWVLGDGQTDMSVMRKVFDS